MWCPNRKPHYWDNNEVFVIGVTRFERATSCSQSLVFNLKCNIHKNLNNSVLSPRKFAWDPRGLNFPPRAPKFRPLPKRFFSRFLRNFNHLDICWRQRQKYFALSILERCRCFCGILWTFGGCIFVAVALQIKIYVPKNVPKNDWCVLFVWALPKSLFAIRRLGGRLSNCCIYLSCCPQAISNSVPHTRLLA